MKKLICLLLALVMMMAVVACGDENKEAYKAAVAAYEAGDYENASLQLYALGDYKDAAALLATIHAEATGAKVEVKTAEGTVNTEVEYVYKDGNLIKENITHADGTVIKNYYKYDDQGLCTSETLNQADGSKVVISHLYDNGNKIRSIRTNADKSKDTYDYTCDANGKIVSHVLTLADGTTEEATYTYSDVTGWLVSIESGSAKTVYSYDQFGNKTNEFVGETETSYFYNYTYSIG